MTINQNSNTENDKDKKGPRYQMGLRSDAWKQMFGDQKVTKDQDKSTKNKGN